MDTYHQALLDQLFSVAEEVSNVLLARGGAPLDRAVERFLEREDWDLQITTATNPPRVDVRLVSKTNQSDDLIIGVIEVPDVPE